jgi:hypothetical protein
MTALVDANIELVDLIRTAVVAVIRTALVCLMRIAIVDLRG